MLIISYSDAGAHRLHDHRSGCRHPELVDRLHRLAAASFSASSPSPAIGPFQVPDIDLSCSKTASAVRSPAFETVAEDQHQNTDSCAQEECAFEHDQPP